MQPSANTGTGGLGKKNTFALDRWLKQGKKDEPFSILTFDTALTVMPLDSTSGLGCMCADNAAESQNQDKAPAA